MSASGSPPPVSTPHACVLNERLDRVAWISQQHRPVLPPKDQGTPKGRPPTGWRAPVRPSAVRTGLYVQQSDGSSDCPSERLHHRSVCHMSPAYNATFSFNFIRSTVQRSTALPDWSDPGALGSTRWSQVVAPPVLETDRRRRLAVSPALQTLLGRVVPEALPWGV